MRRTASLLFAASLSLPAVVDAAPDSLATVDTAAGVFLTGFEADLDGSMSIAATSVDSSTMFTPLRGRAFFGGINGLNDVSADLAETPVAVETGGATDFGANMWIAQGDQVLKRGADGWTSASAPARLDALHAFDSSRIAGVGEGGVAAISTDGGASWTAVPTGTDVDLKGMYWLDDTTGWAWGYSTRTTGGGFDNEEEETFAEGGAVLRSDDGGATWSVVTQRSGEAVGPAFFLADGQTGWLATATIAATGSDADAALWATTDGGATWEAVELPGVVGTVDSGFSQEDVAISFVRSMWWDNPNQGRLFVVAHLFDATSSNSGGGGGSGSSDASGWMIMELTTDTGGKSWDYTPLGTIEMEFSFEGVQAEHDGGVTVGAALSWSRHVLLGADGTVWYTSDWGDDPDHPVTQPDGSVSEGSGGTGDGTGSGRGGGRQVPTGGAGDSGGCATAAGFGPVGLLALLGLLRRRR